MKRILTLLIITMTALNLSAQTKKTVVAYFSASGVTEAAAKELAKEKNADLYSIEPAQKYTAADLDWRNKQSRSSVEMNDPKSRPALKSQKSLADYDVIYLGYPIWWGVAPRIINTFIEQAELDGKTVIPFATSGGSGVEPSVSALKASYPKVKWQKGILMN
ncbi:MAG: NAD(P)H-dependent oxidoreductase [Bacteroidales bacterium]|nr:NAD(P)H-dependent oxidoreductase [Candidatus Colimorpha merdihippi]